MNKHPPCLRGAQSLVRASLVAQMVKKMPAMQETQVRSPGWKDPLEKEMATHSSILPWRIPLTEEPGGLRSMSLKESDTVERLTHPEFSMQDGQKRKPTSE